MKDIIDMSAERGYFIDQSQSLNLFMEGANMAKLTSMHFYAWEKGLKTGMYYLRTKAAQDAIKFTVQKQTKAEVEPVVNSQQTENIPEAQAEQMKADLNKATEVGEIRASELAKAVKEQAEMTPEEQLSCSLDNPDDCVACGS